jgi:hypothetical protein
MNMTYSVTLLHVNALPYKYVSYSTILYKISYVVVPFRTRQPAYAHYTHKKTQITVRKTCAFNVP